MAKLEIRLSPEQHEALDGSLKQFYVPTEDGKGFELEGIGSIQRAFEAEKLKKTTKPELLTELEELRKFKQEQQDAQTKAAQDDLAAKGKYEEAVQAKEKAWNERFETEKAERESLFTDIKRERLTNELVKRGALPDRASYLVGELDAEMELVKGDNGYQLKKKGGIGDATEFDAVIDAAKQKTPFFFAASGASGSGASGSNGNGGGTAAKTMPKAQWDTMGVREQAAFIKSGGKPVD